MSAMLFTDVLGWRLATNSGRSPVTDEELEALSRLSRDERLEVLRVAIMTQIGDELAARRPAIVYSHGC